MYYLYILRSKNDKLYIGQTGSIKNRLDNHKWGIASKFTSQHKGEFRLVYTEQFINRKEAMKREKQLKNWTRAKKEALIQQNISLLKKL